MVWGVDQAAGPGEDTQVSHITSVAVHLRNNAAWNNVGVMQMEKDAKEYLKKAKLRGWRVKEGEQRSCLWLPWGVVPFAEMGNGRGNPTWAC